MVGSGEAGLNIKTLVEGSHETSGELRAAIREDLLRDSVEVEAEYIGVVEVSSTFSGECRFARDEVSLIRVVVDIDADGIEALRSGELGDKIDSDVIPGSGRRSLWL